MSTTHNDVAMQDIILGMQDVHYKESVVSEPAEAGGGLKGVVGGWRDLKGGWRGVKGVVGVPLPKLIRHKTPHSSGGPPWLASLNNLEISKRENADL